MGSVIILLITNGVLLFYFYSIWKGRKQLLKYLSSVGGNKASAVKFKPAVWIPILIFHGILGIVVAYLAYINEKDGRMIFRLLLSLMVALITLILLYAVYFIIVVILKEIIAMKDITIDLILVYSILSCFILLGQVISDKIDYPKGFLWINAVLYVVNLYCIGRLIWMTFKKRVLVKSIWSIAILNFTFAVIALSNTVYEIQEIFTENCFSRTINSWGDALYFVVITFFTVGYGDLFPVREITKIITMVIVFTGFSFTAVFVSAALSATIEHFSNIVKK